MRQAIFLLLLFYQVVNASTPKKEMADESYNITCREFEYVIEQINGQLADKFTLEYQCENIEVEKEFMFGLYTSTVENTKITLNSQFKLCKNAEYASTNIIKFHHDVHLGFNDWNFNAIKKVFNDHSIYLDIVMYGGAGGMTSSYARRIQFPDCND